MVAQERGQEVSIANTLALTFTTHQNIPFPYIYQIYYDYIAPCARCLVEVKDSFSLSLEKTVVPKDVTQDMDEDTLDDYAVVEDGFLSMDEQLVDLLYMEFPSKILCSEDCKGLCSGCGANLNTEECKCKPLVDPRLAPLQAILAELKDNESK